MRNTKVLEMLNENRIDELKKSIEEEIYEESLKHKTGAKQRYAAMKKYFKYHKHVVRECLQKPCEVKFNGKNYISFTNSWSLVLTRESAGEIELFNTETGNYPDVARLISFDGTKKELDFHKVIAEAKSKGYKLVKSEVDAGFKYLMYYGGLYYKIGLIEVTLGIIDDGKPSTVYIFEGKNRPITIETEFGYAAVMPVRFDTGVDPREEGKVVIEVR